MTDTPTDTDLQAKIAAMEHELADLRKCQTDAVRQQFSGSGVQVGRDQSVQGDLVRDKIGQQINTGGGTYVEGDHIVNPEIAPPEDLLAAYYRCVTAECSHLPLGVIDKEFVRASGGSAAQTEQAIPLPDIYVDLDVVAPAQEQSKNARAWALQLALGEGKERTSLLEALGQRAAARTVLLGDAGSGKTTFVNYLAYLLAADPDRLPEPFRGRLLVRLVLREVAARHIPATATHGTAEMLWNALADDIAAHLGKQAADKILPHLQSRLLAEGGFILLDGLDEVPEARQRRQVLLQAIAKLTSALPKDRTRVLVTARPYAYADPDWRLADFATLALAPFSEEQVGRFIERWYQAVRGAMGWNADTARGIGERLRTALQERPTLGDLASRPLLLTLMATLHSSWGQLPEDRAELYEETVKLLLGRWQRAREVRRPDGELEVEPGIAQALGVGEERIRAALEALAFAVHARQRQQPERDAAPADISEGELLVAFKPLLSDLAPDTLLAYLRDRAGLIVARDEGVYAFPHRSFQEYLAACYLANGPEFAERLQALVCADPLWWREVCLLGVGKARQGGLGQAVNVVGTLLPEGPEEVAEPCAAQWQVAALAGQALVELRLREKSQGQPHYEALLRRARRWLEQLVAGGHLAPRARADAGDVLGRLDDPRFTGPLHLPVFVTIPAGTFWMGSAKGGDETPRHQVALAEFALARFPTTHAMFECFIAAGGYATRDWWAEAIAAKRWRDGKVKDYRSEERDRPVYWDDSRFNGANQPVVGVTWYEAVAYCRWLIATLHDGATYRLPTEAEWERAAQGPGGRVYPWGDAWAEDHCNSEELHLNRTTPVGVFPGGVSVEGVLDLAGNVWEWCSDWYAEDVYRPRAGRITRNPAGPDTGDYRVLRGGAYYSETDNVRCASRRRFRPDSWLAYDFGFRVARSSP